MLLLLTVACFRPPPFPTELLEQGAPKLAALGHPQATYQGFDVGSWSAGSPADGQRYLDLKIRYLRPGRPAPNLMTVRVYQQSIAPCRISVDVLSDDGPSPILLDNSLASDAIGTSLCDELARSGR